MREIDLGYYEYRKKEEIEKIEKDLRKAEGELVEAIKYLDLRTREKLMPILEIVTTINRYYEYFINAIDPILQENPQFGKNKLTPLYNKLQNLARDVLKLVDFIKTYGLSPEYDNKLNSELARNYEYLKELSKSFRTVEESYRMTRSTLPTGPEYVFVKKRLEEIISRTSPVIQNIINNLS